MSFQNKVAIVTGASSGIGAAIATKFAAEGAKVALIGRNEEKLKSVADKCKELGNEVLIIVADVDKDEDLRRIVSETISKYGKLDILVNNAGFCEVASAIGEEAVETFDKIIRTNLRSVVFLVSLAAPYLIESKGNVVNISSTVSVGVHVGTGFAYSTSKAGLDHYTRCAALELSLDGVRMNTVNPGPVKTDFIKNMGITGDGEEKVYKAMKKATALGRVSDADEVADLVLFLASDKGKSITGASFFIDNGVRLKSKM